MSPGHFTDRRVGASGSCNGGRAYGNVLVVRNCCYVAVCSAARGASAPTGRRGAGIYRGGRPPTACSFISSDVSERKWYCSVERVPRKTSVDKLFYLTTLGKLFAHVCIVRQSLDQLDAVYCVEMARSFCSCVDVTVRSPTGQSLRVCDAKKRIIPFSAIHTCAVCLTCAPAVKIHSGEI